MSYTDLGRKCPKCQKICSVEEWPSKFTTYCKICWAKYSADSRKIHGDRYRKNNRTSWNKNKDKYNMARKLGGKDLYDKMFMDQGGVCKICKLPQMGGRYKTLTVDHCHDTMMIRGLLCNNCNRALGMFKDSATVLSAAIQYLEDEDNFYGSR